jgi:chromosome condensin MukBEF ATPase and DNA-binding subunit MukB
MESSKLATRLRRAIALLLVGAALLLPVSALTGFAGVAHASDSVDDAKQKSVEALEAITRALQDLAAKAEAQAKDAAVRAREELRSALEKSCSSAYDACKQVCGSDDTCLRACKEGRKACQS